MHQDAFNSLSLDEKAELVFQRDAYVDTREYYNQTINLYLVKGLYVEVWYFQPTKSINRIRVAENKNLHLYFKHVDISELTDI